MSKILEITHTWLIAANIYYGLFSKLIKDPEVLVIESPFSVKIFKMSASSSPANSYSGRSARFVKCFGHLGSMKGPILFMKIKGLLQPLVDRIISLLPSDISSIGDGNSKQLQFNCILWFDFSFGQLLTV